MPGRFVSNEDGTLILWPEEWELLPGQSVICAEDDPNRDQKLTKFVGVEIELPPYKKEGDILPPSFTRERSTG